MAKPSVAHLAVSKSLLDHESAADAGALDHAVAAGRVLETLFQTLTPIIGVAGAHALFARSMKLARAEFVDLAKFGDPGEPSGNQPDVASYLVERLRTLAPDVRTEAAAGLLAVFLGLLTKFIGEPLVRQIVHKAFPSIDKNQTKDSA